MSMERRFRCRIFLLALFIVSLAGTPTVAEAQVTIADNTPQFVPSAKPVSGVNPSAVMEVSVWLKPRNKAGLDALVQSLYNPDSSSYRRWITKAQFEADYAPTADQVQVVSRFLSASGLTVSKLGPDNFYVRATGTAAQVSSAFHVELNNYQVNGQAIRANAKDPSVSDEAGPLVASVTGLDSMGYNHPLISRAASIEAASPSRSASALARPSVATAPASLSFNAACFPGTTTQTYTTDGSLPKATFKGNEYTGNVSECGYTPAQIRDAYGLNALYADKLDGRGQTVVILDWCGSPTITQDANAFSAQFGLPKLTASNFKIIYTPTPSYCEAPDPEIDLDVEWTHAIAPGAAIDLVVPPSQSFQDMDEGLFYAIDYHLGNVISGSYGTEELYVAKSILTTQNLITEIGAAMGISADFATGDDGDYTFDDPQAYTASVSAPADSPYATAVGGVTMALNSNNTIAWQSGWGNNINQVSSAGYVIDPPADGYFYAGSGGGESSVFAKPSFQQALPGTGRLLPDVSWLADPYTGVYIAESVPGVTPELQYYAYGGTSLACPMFSALWAIANQVAKEPLGQAAPYLYRLPPTVVTDIVPVSSKTNVTGTIIDSDGMTHYSAAYLAAPLGHTTSFISTLWNYPLNEDTAFILTFGTDSSLTVKKGWDNVTGIGVLNPKGFTEYMKP